MEQNIRSEPSKPLQQQMNSVVSDVNANNQPLPRGSQGRFRDALRDTAPQDYNELSASTDSDNDENDSSNDARKSRRDKKSGKPNLRPSSAPQTQQSLPKTQLQPPSNDNSFESPGDQSQATGNEVNYTRKPGKQCHRGGQSSECAKLKDPNAFDPQDLRTQECSGLLSPQCTTTRAISPAELARELDQRCNTTPSTDVNEPGYAQSTFASESRKRDASSDSTGAASGGSSRIDSHCRCRGRGRGSNRSTSAISRGNSRCTSCVASRSPSTSRNGSSSTEAWPTAAMGLHEHSEEQYELMGGRSNEQQDQDRQSEKYQKKKQFDAENSKSTKNQRNRDSEQTWEGFCDSDRE